MPYLPGASRSQVARVITVLTWRPLAPGECGEGLMNVLGV